MTIKVYSDYPLPKEQDVMRIGSWFGTRDYWSRVPYT